MGNKKLEIFDLTKGYSALVNYQRQELNITCTANTLGKLSEINLSF